MNAALWIFIAVAFGLMAFVSIQDNIPEELGFLKSAGTNIMEGSEPAEPVVGQLEGWTITQQGPVLEATHRMNGELTVGGTAYDVPTIGILCNAGVLDARIDTRLRTTGAKTTPVGLDGKTLDWAKGAELNVFPADARAFTQYLAGRTTAAFTFSFADLGKQTVVLDTRQLKQVLQAFPAACR